MNRPCPARAAWCECHLEEGHKGPHECNPKACTGSWEGEIDTPNFKVVAMPFKVVAQ